ncbi:macrophage mannose receptor 1-like protein, partial [Leptotrombidium deliense]
NTALCQCDWAFYNNRCYYKSLHIYLNFKEADSYCKKLNASLVSIHSPEENEFVVNFKNKKDKYWLNGQQQEIKSEKFKWLDGSEFNYTNWFLGNQPIHLDEDYINCLSIFPQNGRWQDENCLTRMLLLCVAQSNGSCPYDWTLYNKQCFFKDTESMDFVNAQKYCKSLNSSLVSIHSENENEFVRNFIKRYRRNVWLNGKQHALKSSNIRWLDGSEFNYANWHAWSYQPDEIKEDHLNCVVLTDYGYWLDENCFDPFNDYKALCVKNNEE